MKKRLVFVIAMVAALSLSPTAKSDSLTPGEVVKIDGPAGTITVEHGPLRHLGQTAPKVVDTFRVAGEVMQGMAFNALRPGDHITFRAKRVNGVLTITEADKK